MAMRFPLDLDRLRVNQSNKTLTYNGKTILLSFFDERPSGYHGTVDVGANSGE